MISFPPGTEMFQFPGLSRRTYVFSAPYRRITSGGFPHSGIRGSQAIQRLLAAYRSRSRPSSTPGAKASTMCPSYLDGDQALLGPEGPRERPVIPVGWQPIVAISCQLAWLCSFQGPRKALRPVWAIGLSKLNSMRPPGTDSKAVAESRGRPAPLRSRAGARSGRRSRTGRELGAAVCDDGMAGAPVLELP